MHYKDKKNLGYNSKLRDECQVNRYEDPQYIELKPGHNAYRYGCKFCTTHFLTYEGKIHHEIKCKNS